MDAICQHASTALAGPYDQVRDWVLDQDALHVDETGWLTAGDSRALWTASTADASLFQIAEHCNREQFNELIGPFSGILVSDRWNGYEHLDPTRRQVCWSHIQRDFRRHSEGLAEQKTFGEQVEPTNNPAGRALRGPVIHRKLSHGARSHHGERFAERALSAATTCRQQHRSLFEFLTELLTAHTRLPASRAHLRPGLNGYSFHRG